MELSRLRITALLYDTPHITVNITINSTINIYYPLWMEFVGPLRAQQHPQEGSMRDDQPTRRTGSSLLPTDNIPIIALIVTW